jgi:hypothetical protein
MKTGSSVATRSNSELKGLTAQERLIYLWRVSLLYVERRGNPAEFDYLGSDFECYRDVFETQTGQHLRNARIFELGFGQRPFRLMLLQSLGYDARGVDLDHPLYQLNFRNVASVFRSNGPLRTAKSVLRRVVFDGAEYKTFENFIARRFGRPFSFDPSRLFTGNASDPAVWSRAGGPFDFVYSEDVFEHIPREQLPSVAAAMAGSLTENGLAVIKPMIFTGISGGHDLGWYPHQVERDDIARGPAWGHLTGETRPADTFLNKLSLRDFRELFQTRFEIVREERTLGDLGRRHLTAQRRSALSKFSEEELFSNTVRFVLRKKK